MNHQKMKKEELQKLFKPASKSKNQIGPITISNLQELKNLVERLKPGISEGNAPIVIDTVGTTLADDNFKGKVTIPQAGGQATLRKTMLDGFEMVKNHQSHYRASIASQNMYDEYGGYLPAPVPDPNEHLMWIDRFIKNNLGGKREGLTIIWELPEGKFQLDPWTCQLEKIG